MLENGGEGGSIIRGASQGIPMDPDAAADARSVHTPSNDSKCAYTFCNSLIEPGNVSISCDFNFSRLFTLAPCSTFRGDQTALMWVL